MQRRAVISTSSRGCGILSQLSIIHRHHLRQIRPSGVASRLNMTSTSESKKPNAQTPILDRVVDKLNISIRTHPGETIAVLLASDIGSIGAMYGIISLTGLEFSPEFALAFAASRPFRRFRLPLDLAVAAGVKRVFPALSKVRLSELASALPNRSRISNAGVLSTTMDRVKEVVDNYGAAYMMGSRLAGVAVVYSLYALIKQGVDVMPILVSLGMEGAGGALGDYAAAVVFGSTIYPLTLGASGYVVPVVAKLRKTIMS
ncbi:uncharacterized protein PHALS_01382 [Plasmopara halstedii]|uniref:Transmembrane protein n=1 Tax=Plasmopara halstedii TaxID=4781 RepID=A0A0P1AVI8_PLAHL|nr:uncharacterized protein PHALS_01382 [Plasmopara halstedii]CEG45055.1 transmembrane protein [Plasmopara halstedii]|eukprot:XP_024581424.1 transmembrane protein [Plasmopara halstedii]